MRLFFRQVPWVVLVFFCSAPVVRSEDEPDTAEAFAEAERRIVVIADAPWAPALPGGLVVEASFDAVHVLLAPDAVDEALLNAVAVLPGVEAADRDRLYFFAADPKDHAAFLPGAADAGPGGRPRCPLSDRCGDGRSRFWAQEAVDAKAMKERLRRLAPSITVKVAVIDSGFDATQRAAYDTVGPIRTRTLDGSSTAPKATTVGGKKVSPTIGDPNRDEVGHGTAVASTIAGKGDLGVAEKVSLSIYRVTPPGGAMSTSGAKLELALARACEQNQDPSGITILNMSWAEDVDESGGRREQVTRAPLIQRLAEKGCLVVKAAGNDAYRREHATDDLDDAYLRVGAVDPTRAPTTFSSRGEVSAPGAGVHVVKSRDILGATDGKKVCTESDRDKKNPRWLVNGTSFAAPIVAGIASQVVRALKAGTAFAKLSKRERITLVNRIVKAAELGGSVNGLRAVAIAERWSRKGKLLDVAALTALLDADPDRICGEAVTRCQEIRACVDVRSCFENGKKRVALCPAAAAGTAGALARTAFAHGYREAGFAYARMASLGEDPTARAALTKQALDAYLASLGGTPSAMDPNGVSQIVLPYLEACSVEGNCDPALVRSLLRGALTAPAVHAFLARQPDRRPAEDRGTRSLVESMGRLLDLSRDALGETEMKSLVAGAARVPGSLGTIARVLDEAIRGEAEGTPYATTLRDLEKGIREQLVRAKPVVTGASRLAYQGLIERDLASIDRAVASGDLAPLSALHVHYLLSNLDRYPKWKAKKAEVLQAVLEHVAAGRGWGLGNDGQLFPMALRALGSESLRMTRGPLDALKRKFRTALLAAESPWPVAWVLREAAADRKRGEAPSVSKPFLEADTVRLLARKMATTVSGSEAPKISRLLFDRAMLGETARRLATPGLGADREALDGMATWALTRYGDRRERGHVRELMSVLFSLSGTGAFTLRDRDALVKAFSPGTRWRAAARDLLDRARAEPSRYDAGTIKNIKEFLDATTLRLGRR